MCSNYGEIFFSECFAKDRRQSYRTYIVSNYLLFLATEFHFEANIHKNCKIIYKVQLIHIDCICIIDSITDKHTDNDVIFNFPFHIHSEPHSLRLKSNCTGKMDFANRNLYLTVTFDVLPQSVQS
jgi:hypothetical protein